jgi:hypothetical protein
MTRGLEPSTRLVTLLLSAMLAFAPAAAGASAPSKVIGMGTKVKGANMWFVQGNATAVRTISVRVVPSPAQPVTVHWAVVCQKNDPYDPAMHVSAQGKSGEASIGAAATVKLTLPYAKPPTCVATVYATLKSSGRVALRLLQT